MRDYETPQTIGSVATRNVPFPDTVFMWSEFTETNIITMKLRRQ